MASKNPKRSQTLEDRDTPLRVTWQEGTLKPSDVSQAFAREPFGNTAMSISDAVIVSSQNLSETPLLLPCLSSSFSPSSFSWVQFSGKLWLIHSPCSTFWQWTCCRTELAEWLLDSYYPLLKEKGPQISHQLPCHHIYMWLPFISVNKKESRDKGRKGFKNIKNLYKTHGKWIWLYQNQELKCSRTIDKWKNDT